MLWEHDVAGSNPAAPTNNYSGLRLWRNPFFVYWEIVWKNIFINQSNSIRHQILSPQKQIDACVRLHGFLSNGDLESIRDRCTCFDLSITPTLQPDMTGLNEDLRLKDGMAISAPVRCGFMHLHTEGLHHLNGLAFTVTPTLLNMLKIDTYVRCLALTYRQEVMNCKPRWAETTPKVYAHEGMMKNIGFWRFWRRCVPCRTHPGHCPRQWRWGDQRGFADYRLSQKLYCARPLRLSGMQVAGL